MKIPTLLKIVLGIILLMVFWAFYSMHNLTQEVTHEYATEYPLQAALKKWPKKLLDSALPTVRAEPKVKSAKWTQLAPRYGDIACLQVTLVPDGTRRDGYADYLCQVLLDFDIHGTAVEIRDVHNPKGLPMGSAMCTY